MSETEIQQKIIELENEMQAYDFWENKLRAQEVFKELAKLKEDALGARKYDNGDAIVTIFSGAGGDDAEDFSSILFDMYSKYITKMGWGMYVIHKHENDHGGYRNITFEISGRGAYGNLKNESGVHRLVRVSPFNAKKLRHTSFSMVEVIPKFKRGEAFELPESELQVEFSRSSGPGGQNVNKRETAVRVVHIPTNLSAHSEAERSQADNKAKAIDILRGKLYKQLEEERIKKEGEMYISKTTSAEWGSQIRSYVLHPYKMVKDHRTDVETSDVEGVLDGNLEEFIEAGKNIETKHKTTS